MVLAKNALDRAKDNRDEFSGRSKDDPARALALTELAGALRDYDAALRNVNWYTGHPTEIQQEMLDAEVATAGQVTLVLADFLSWMVETDNLTEIELPSIAAGEPVLVTFDALSDVELAGLVSTNSPSLRLRAAM